MRPNLPSARLEVEQLQGYSAPLEGRRGLLRLDFNENTIGPTPLVISTIKTLPCDHYAIYPEYEGLREKIIFSIEGNNLIDTDQIGIFNGVDAALHAICHAFGGVGEKMITTNPTFGYYAPCAHMQGMHLEAIPNTLPDLSFPFQKVYESLPTAKILLLCNPNNPTGTRLLPEKILELAAASRTTLVVVDELYENFTGDSVLPEIARLVNNSTNQGNIGNIFSTIPNLIILRSLAKTAGIAGLRLGFAIGPAGLINRINRVTGPYDVNSLAVNATFAALSDRFYIDSYISEILQARTWLIHHLNLKNICYHVKGGNYILIWPKQPADQVYQYLLEMGILIRAMSKKPQINGSIRVSIGTIRQMQHFLLSYLKIESL